MTTNAPNKNNGMKLPKVSPIPKPPNKKYPVIVDEAIAELKAITVINAYQVECDDNDLVCLKSDVDKVISTLKAERDEYRYNLSCARNEIHNISKGMREDIETIARLTDELQEQKDKADKLLSCLKCLVMRDLIKDCTEKASAIEIVKEFQ